MRKRLLKVGKSFAIVLDRPVLNRVGVDVHEGAAIEFDIDVKENSIVMTPVRSEPSTDEEFDRHLIDRALDLIMRMRREGFDESAVSADLETLQRHVAMQLEGRDIDVDMDPRVVADEYSFRPGRTLKRQEADQFLARTVRALRASSGQRGGPPPVPSDDGPDAPDVPAVEVEQTKLPRRTREERYKPGRGR